MPIRRFSRRAAVVGPLIVSAALSLFLTACDHQPKTGRERKRTP